MVIILLTHGLRWAPASSGMALDRTRTRNNGQQAAEAARSLYAEISAPTSAIIALQAILSKCRS
jgi:hypothetical protein